MNELVSSIISAFVVGLGGGVLISVITAIIAISLLPRKK